MTKSPGPFYFTTLPNGWTVGRFGALDAIGGVVHAVTTRLGPDVAMVHSDEFAAANLLSEALNLGGVAWVEQVHGRTAVSASTGGCCGQADAVATNRPQLGVSGRSADCPLILLADAGGGSVGMAHASWRSMVGRIASRLVSHMVEQFSADPARMVACICPSAGPCCYEVGHEVLQAAAEGLGPHARGFFRHGGGKTYLDLWQANADQLLRSGLRAENVHVAGICTLCRNDLFPSYRLEGERAGRFMAVIARGWSGLEGAA